MTKKKKIDILSSKNPAAVALGKLGGLARAKKLTKKRRQEIATAAVNARWSKRDEKQQSVQSDESS